MKISRTYTIEEDIVRKLSTEENASALIETLLRNYYDLQPLREAVSVDELDAKAKELNLKLEEINEKKREAMTDDEKQAKLTKLGIDNKFLIQRLEKAQKKDIFVFRELKRQYEIPEILALYKAWDILHDINE